MEDSPMILALQRTWQKDHKFKANLAYTASNFPGYTDSKVINMVRRALKKSPIYNYGLAGAG